MRRTWAIATAAVLAAGTLGAQAGGATGPGRAAPRRPRRPAAMTALQQHPGAARATEGPGVPGRSTPSPTRDGSTHVRMQRTLDGVPVLAATSSCTAARRPAGRASARPWAPR